MISLITILLTVTYNMSLLVLPFSGLEKKFLNTDYSSFNAKENKCLLFSEPMSTGCENSNSEGDSSPDDDEIIGQVVFSLFIPSGYLQLEQGKNKLTSIYLGTPLLPPENHS